MRDAVGAAGNLAAVARGGGTGEGVGAGIVDRFHLPRQDRAVAFHAGLDTHHRRVAVAGEKDFLARQLPLNRAPGLAGQGRGQGLQPQVHLAAVAAADVGNHHTDHGLRQLEQLGELDPYGRGVLGSGIDRQLARRIPKGGDHVGLQVAVLDLGGGEGVLEDQVRSGETLLRVAAAERCRRSTRWTGPRSGSGPRPDGFRTAPGFRGESAPLGPWPPPDPPPASGARIRPG